MSAAMESEKLEACPFCGGHDLFVERADYSSCYVICNDCSARGPVSCDENSADSEASEAGECEPGEMPARRLWNARAVLTPPADGGAALDARLRALDEAVGECKRVASETTFAAEVSAEQREGYRQGAEMCAMTIGMIAQASLKDLRFDAPPAPADGGEERAQLLSELAPLVEKAAGPNGWDWMFPLKVNPVDGKPTIVSHKGGNLFRGYIGTWREADLLVALANAAPRILAAIADLASSQSDLELWKREAADRSEGMVQLNLDRAAMGVAIEQLREALVQADLKIRSYPGADQSDVDFIRIVLQETQHVH